MIIIILLLTINLFNNIYSANEFFSGEKRNISSLPEYNQEFQIPLVKKFKPDQDSSNQLSFDKEIITTKFSPFDPAKNIIQEFYNQNTEIHSPETEEKNLFEDSLLLSKLPKMPYKKHEKNIELKNSTTPDFFIHDSFIHENNNNSNENNNKRVKRSHHYHSKENINEILALAKKGKNNKKISEIFKDKGIFLTLNQVKNIKHMYGPKINKKIPDEIKKTILDLAKTKPINKRTIQIIFEELKEKYLILTKNIVYYIINKYKLENGEVKHKYSTKPTKKNKVISEAENKSVEVEEINEAIFEDENNNFVSEDEENSYSLS